ncbi:MAG: vanadium-dependent haloperoxidase [Chitinophagaceae bacterium]
MDDATFRRSQAFGRAVASAMIEWSSSDNYNFSNAGYISPTFPGAWQPTPPAFAGALAPFVKDARPFIEKNLHFTIPAFPFAYSENPASAYYKMAKEVYDISKNLTPQQREIALFWNNEGVRKGYTVQGHSINIVIQLLEKLDLSLAVAAVLYAKAGIALRDAQIVLSKANYNNPLVRPVTYIRKLTDPAWLPLVVTPPYPEYPAAHSFVTSAVMQVLRREIGYEYPITDNTNELLGFGIRNFESYRALAEEAGVAGFFGGVHYKYSIDVGLASGQDFGNRVADVRVTPPF